MLCLWNNPYLIDLKILKKKKIYETHRNLSNVVCLIAGEYGYEVINYFVVRTDTIYIIKEVCIF